VAGFALAKFEPPKQPAQEPRIVLAWLCHLRWLAVVGQVLACVVAAGAAHLPVSVRPVALVIALTALSNVAVILHIRRNEPARWLVPGILLLDVLLLTALLYFNGGSHNPFAALYLVHVAMAVVVAPAVWTWIIVAAVAGGYGTLSFGHVPGSGLLLPHDATSLLNWVALVLVAVVIAYFIGRLTRSLRMRERQLADLREQSSRNERLAALTTLAAGAAHELGTPLATIAVVAKELELACSRSSNGIGDDARLIRQ